MKKFITLFSLLTSLVFFAQNKSCETPEEDFEDFNSITKCSIKPKGKKNIRQISVRISVPKKRFLRNRKKNKVNTAGKINSNNIKSAGNKIAETSKTILKISNTLSSKEVQQAEKFSTIDKIPTFKGCENFENEERLECFNQKMIAHIEKNLRYPNEAIINKIQGEVWVRFIIDKEGNVSNIKAMDFKKNNQLLKDEAIRVISKLPVLIPGFKNGKNTTVKYGFPINFALGE